MTDLTELLGKVERAVGPDREIDAMIMCATCAPSSAFVRQSTINGAWCIYEIGYTGKERLWEDRGHHRPEGWKVTASLDAALALVERVLPGCDWCLSVEGKMALATIWPTRAAEPEYGHTGPAPALALVAATLKALIAQEDEQGSARSKPCGAGSASHAGPQPQSKDSDQ